MATTNYTTQTTHSPISTTFRPNVTTPKLVPPLARRTTPSPHLFESTSPFYTSLIVGVSSFMFAVLLVCMAVLYRHRRRQRYKPPTTMSGLSPSAADRHEQRLFTSAAVDTVNRESHLLRIYPSTGSSSRVNMSMHATSFVSPEVDMNDGYTTNPAWASLAQALSLPVRVIPPASVKPLRKGSEVLVRQHATSSSTITSWRLTHSFAEHPTVKDSAEQWTSKDLRAPRCDIIRIEGVRGGTAILGGDIAMWRQISAKSGARQSLRRQVSSNNGPSKPIGHSPVMEKPPAAPVPPPTSKLAATAKKPEWSKPLTAKPSPPKSNGGGAVYAVLLASVTATAGLGYYIHENPNFNPNLLKDNDVFLKFREFVLSSFPTARSGLSSTAITLPETSKAKPTPSPVDKVKLAKKKTVEIKNAADSKQTSDVKKASTSSDASITPSEATPPTVVVAKDDVKDDAKADVETTTATAVTEPAAVVASDDKEDDNTHSIAEVAAAIVKQAEHVVEVAEAVVHEELHKAEKVLLSEAQKATTALQKKLDEASAKEKDAIDELNRELVAFEDKAKEVSAATKNKVVKKARAEADALGEELDHTILAGIKELDAESLRLRVAQLATEMKNRSKWEAVRLMESLRRMEEEVHAQHAELLRQQDVLHKDLLARELRLQEELITRTARQELDAVRAQHESQLKALVESEKAVVQAAFDHQLATLQADADKKVAETIAQKVHEVQAATEKDQAGRIRELNDVRVQLKAVNELLGATSNYEAFSHKVHKVSVAALALTNRIEAAAPLHSEINALRTAGKGDELIEAAVTTLAKFGDGAPSVAQLQDRFKVVQKAARQAALVPESSQGGGMVGHLFANALHFLLIPPGGPIQGTDAEAVFSRAEYALRGGDIESAVAEVDKLTGLPHDVVADWVAAAKSRLAVEQTAKVVKAHISLLAASLS
ncbi:hypothetical protein B5M09_000331 [Aphanomyces astaci]|uniref:MICOS complex subunit MIC60 n=2 Tax=Aphanomyces astaci TaxID=112090 RepID=A0A425DFH3_APHAT|nr:hypothetical protein B5M09_000331 [Aphanomyces astaci]